VRAEVPSVTVLGVRVARLTAQQALDEIERLHAAGPALVAFANAHSLNLAVDDPGYAELLNGAELMLNDGSGLAIAARWRGAPFPENLNGTDFTPRVLELAARRGWRVHLLGGRPGVAERAAALLTSRIDGLDVVGTGDGYFDRDDPAAVGAVVEGIRALDVDVLLVAMGNPLQERWLAEHLTSTGAAIGVAVGAFFDFTAGDVRRAPAWMRRVGVEWVWRLGLEPGRMWRRYVLGNPRFLLRVAREQLRRPGPRRPPPERHR